MTELILEAKIKNPNYMFLFPLSLKKVEKKKMKTRRLKRNIHLASFISGISDYIYS